jgi:Rieske Fe-S protein
MINRRGFLRTAVAAVAAFLLMPVRKAYAKKLAIGLDKADALKTVGGSIVLKVKDRSILFVRDSDTTVKGFDPVCPHQNCTIGWDAKAGCLKCPCHASNFAPDGKVLSGPAPRPLKTYDCSLDDQRIIVSVDD